MLPDLRDACARAVAELVQTGPELIVVAGAAAETAKWDPACHLDLSAYAPPLGPDGGQPGPDGQPGLPLSLGLGALLLDQAGYTGRRALQAVGADEPAAACTALGAKLAGDPRTAVLAMGDGSARRSTSAPGYLDERDGDLAALASLDPGLARDLMATGRAAWQVLAGALGPARPSTEVLYTDAPFGVAYLVAVFTPR